MDELRAPAVRRLGPGARFLLTVLVALLLASAGCAAPQSRDRKSIVVTYSLLGAVVSELVGDQASVTVLVPNGQDIHEWEPSAKDIEALMRADLVVENGLGLEAGMGRVLQQAREAGVPFFTAADHITVRKVGPGEGIPSDDPHRVIGADDPHLWLDPLAMEAIVAPLAEQIRARLGLDVSARAEDLEARLRALDSELAALVETLPPERRKLVTGHESLGYFAQRYGFELIGAIVPSISTQAEVSAADLAALKEQIQENNVPVVFTELGTPRAVVDAIAAETGARTVELNTHILPEDGSYLTFMRQLTQDIVNGLR